MFSEASHPFIIREGLSVLGSPIPTRLTGEAHCVVFAGHEAPGTDAFSVGRIVAQGTLAVIYGVVAIQIRPARASYLSYDNPEMRKNQLKCQKANKSIYLQKEETFKQY